MKLLLNTIFIKEHQLLRLLSLFLHELTWLICWLISFAHCSYAGLLTIKVIGRLQPTQPCKHRLSYSLTNSVYIYIYISRILSMVVACSLPYGFICYMCYPSLWWLGLVIARSYRFTIIHLCTSPRYMSYIWWSIVAKCKHTVIQS